MFQVFGVIQKQQVKKKAFHNNEASFTRLTPEDLITVAQEEAKKEAPSNPTIRALKKHVSTVQANITGTDESRISICTYIWGMMVMKNPLSLWITINPTDTHDPIVQVLVGDQINLDAFDRTAGPDSAQRAKIVVDDPYAAAKKKIHFVIGAILEELFSITIHSHAKFQSHIAAYITSNIQAHHDHVTEESLVTIPREKAMSYSWPLNPRQSSFARSQFAVEGQLARAVQIHNCGLGCLKVSGGHMLCKRHAPFPLAPDAWIDSNGNWGPHRSYCFLNNWNLTILLATRSNHDIKLITNGDGTKHIACREQEFSAPEVVSYLMGGGDRYIPPFPDHLLDFCGFHSKGSSSAEGLTVQVDTMSSQSKYVTVEMHDGSL
ncbi:uncharacterized protein EDB91DRAFT_1078082 [Suillus paluster]|uniref:uncharacterized protein n=1 Tax=Suillus paluster TaxID=48578 RepID=UPI001B86BA4B|nr:uncharacterized protein EDB91DRAFT_1078082 [Suillus paluster]KAG1751263.1 hypothetical protein EDB91DRAFT_1078082 [Suillus paluster]